MSKQHKWHKEIKAWADGAEIQSRNLKSDNTFTSWESNINPKWYVTGGNEYRIKPQPKEPQYLYVYVDPSWDVHSYKICHKQGDFGTYVGKIKLEDVE